MLFYSLIERLSSGVESVLDQPLDVWMLLGFVGQAAFMSRFLVQWLASERAGRSTVPIAFWFLSIAGGLLLLSYALTRRDPVFIAGQSFGLVVYTRNLMLIMRKSPAQPSRQDGDPAQQHTDFGAY